MYGRSNTRITITEKTEIKRYLGEFSSVLVALEENEMGAHYALIGGLAVAYWKKYFFPDEKEIDSKDMDLCARLPAAQTIGEAFNCGCESLCFFETKMRRFRLKDPADKAPLIVELLERLPGVDKDIQANPQGCVMRMQFDGPPVISIMSPMDLFITKLGVWENPNAREIGYDDVHLEILSRVIPPFLEMAGAMYKEGKLPRNPAVAANRLLARLAETPGLPERVKPFLGAMIESLHRHTQGVTQMEFYSSSH